MRRTTPQAKTAGATMPPTMTANQKKTSLTSMEAKLRPVRPVHPPTKRPYRFHHLEAPCNSLPFPGIRSMSGRVTYSGFLIPARQWEPRVPLPSTRLGVSHPLSSFYVGWGYTYLHSPLGSPESCAFQGRPARLGVFHPVCRSRRLPRFFRHLVDALRERCSQNEA
jgi:hypothetical protein